MADVEEIITEPVLKAIPEIGHVKDVSWRVYEWATTHLFTMSALQQLLFVALTVIFAWQAARRIENFIDARGSRWHPWLLAVTRIFVLTRHEVLLLVCLPLALGLVALLFAAAEWPVQLIEVAATLSAVWSVIRLCSGIIQSPFLSQAVAVFFWALAALNIFGWLSPVIVFLDKASVPIGTGKLSLLLMVKSCLFIMVLYWVASALASGLDRILYHSDSLNPSQKVLFGKVFRILLFVVSFIFVLNFAGIDLTALAIFSGALGIGIGFGLQRVFANLISGFILLMDKSIKPGDVVAIEDT
jgi:small-conductance mechanosensitive channel